MSRIFIFVIALGTLLPSIGFSDEGLRPITELKNEAGYRDAYWEVTGCGGAKIHSSRNLILTALHCVTNEIDSISPLSEKQYGNEFAYDAIVRFLPLQGTMLKNGMKVIAAGKCWTGLDLEALSISPEFQKEAVECGLEDWAILESPTAGPSQCFPINLSEKETVSVFAMGATKKKIERLGTTLDLKGNVYTEGNGLSETSLTQESHVFRDLWKGLLPTIGKTLFDSFRITDGDVLNGMSGGPVVNRQFELIGVTATALMPTNLWKFPGAHSFESGYNAGIHGAIRIEDIKRQMDSSGEAFFSSLFDCK